MLACHAHRSFPSAIARGSRRTCRVLYRWPADLKAFTIWNLNPLHRVGDEIDRLNGVPICFNGAVDHCGERNVAPDGCNLGLPFQCVKSAGGVGRKASALPLPFRELFTGGRGARIFDGFVNRQRLFRAGYSLGTPAEGVESDGGVEEGMGFTPLVPGLAGEVYHA